MQTKHEVFCEQLKDLGHLCGYRIARFRPAMTEHGWRTPVAADGKGWPDMVFAKAERLIFAEIKIPPDKLRPEQAEWMDVLQSSAECYVWTPDQWDSIVEVLNKQRRQQDDREITGADNTTLWERQI